MMLHSPVDLDGCLFKVLISIECHCLSVGGGRVVRRCLVNFQCRGVLLTRNTVGQGPVVLAVGAGGGCLDIFSLLYHFSFLSPSLWVGWLVGCFWA